jgi:hypothetical protein
MTSFDPRQFPLDRPGKLIAALPAVLGFVPEKSLVLVTLERGELGCVMRADLSDDACDSVVHMAAVAAASCPDGAIVVIVDEEGASCRMCNDDYRELTRVATYALEEHGIELRDAHVVDRIAAGGRWHRADGPGGGVVEDPSSSPLAVAAVLDGRRLCATRDELLDVITATDLEHSAVLSEVIERAAHDGGSRPDAAARRDVELAMAAAADVAEGRIVTDDDVARLAWALTDPRVRDTLYALAVGRTGDQVEALWALLSRVLPEPWRVEALVLLAFSAYVRGDGPLAGVSLEAALRGNASHKMAQMLDQALQSGMRPEQIRELARTGYRLAKRIGVVLPPRRNFRRRAG